MREDARVTEPPIANTEQAEAWNSEEGQHWAAHQDRYDAMSGAFTEHLLGAAAITETDTVLDIGCGNGQTTRLAARRASRGRAVGLDLSAPMLERAAATSDGEVTRVRRRPRRVGRCANAARSRRRRRGRVLERHRDGPSVARHGRRTHG